MMANRSGTGSIMFSTRLAFGILLISVLIWISIHVGFDSIYSSLSLRYFMMMLLLCISALLIRVLTKVRRSGASILVLLLLAFAVKYQFYVNFSYIYDRDNPVLLGAVERMLEYSSIPPDSALSAYQQFYYKHPGFILTSSIIYMVTGFTRIEMLVILFLVIFTLSYLFIFIYISNYYDSLTGLLSMLLILFMGGYAIYAVFSRGTISFILMFASLILLNYVFKERKAAHFVPILIILLSLTIIHDLTTTILASIMVVMGVAYFIIGFAEKNNKFRTFNSSLLNLIMISITTLVAYDIYKSHLIFEQYLPEILNLEESQIRPQVIFRERTLRELLSLISRTAFWFIAGITVLIHIVKYVLKQKCPRGVYDLSFGIASGTLIIASIISGFLPPRLWIYAYILLIPLTIHALLFSFDSRSNSKKMMYVRVAGVVLVMSYLFSQFSALSPFALSPFEYHLQEYETGDYRWKWSLREIEGVNWLYSKLDQENKRYTVIGDIGSYLIALRYPIRITSSLNDIKLAIEGITGGEKNIILYRAEMEYILRGYDSFVLSNNETSKCLDEYYSKFYMNGELSLYYS
jgi:hypothetical protein